MPHSPEQAISTLESIKSVEDADELERLEEALADLRSSDRPELGMKAMLSVFERFPEETTGYGIFWSILGDLEGMPGYEKPLIESVQAHPSEFGLMMVNRMLNSGRTQVGDVDLLSLLEKVANDNKQTETIRRRAGGFAEQQRNIRMRITR